LLCYNLFENLNNSNAYIFRNYFYFVQLCEDYVQKDSTNSNDGEIKSIKNIDLEEYLNSILKNVNEIKKIWKLSGYDKSPNPQNIKTINKSYVIGVQGKADEKNAKILIDTGSDVNVIKKSFYVPCIAKAVTSQNYERKILRISVIDDIDVISEFKLVNDIRGFMKMK